MNELLDFSEKMLDEHGEFHPFGGYMKTPTDVVHVGVELESNTQDAKSRIEAIVNSFREMSNEAIAFGIASNVALPKSDDTKCDAVRIFLEHRDGYCADVFFCYVLTSTGGIEITQTIAQQGEPIFFSSRH